jgi:hypothetical protein
MLLVDACTQYEKLTGELPPLFLIHRTWFMANHPDFFNFPEESKRTLLRASGPSVVKMGRAGYFYAVLPEVMNIRVK